MNCLQHVAWKLVDIVNLMSKMKVYKVPLTLVEHDSDIKIKACTQKSLSHLLPGFVLRYQVSVYRTIVTLVFIL